MGVGLEKKNYMYSTEIVYEYVCIIFRTKMEIQLFIVQCMAIGIWLFAH